MDARTSLVVAALGITTLLSCGPSAAQDRITSREQQARQLFVEAFSAARPCRELVAAFFARAGQQTDSVRQLQTQCNDALPSIRVAEQLLLTDYKDTDAAFELAKQGGWTAGLSAAMAGLESLRKQLAPAPPAAATPTPPAAASSRLLISEVDAFRTQVERCWSVPAGDLDTRNLTVTLRLFLTQEGTLSRAPEVIDGARMNRTGEDAFRAAAESAVRAVQRCAPYRMLPMAKYDTWREIELTFDPSKVLR